MWLVQKCANNAALCYYYALTLTHHHTNDTKGGATTAKCKLPLFLTCRRIMFGRPFIISGQVCWLPRGFVVLLHISLWSVSAYVPREPHSNRRRHYIYDGYPPCSYTDGNFCDTECSCPVEAQCSCPAKKDGLSFLPLPRLAGWCRC